MIETQKSDDASTRTLILRRTFGAPRERVFEAWTKRDVLMRWWGPKSVETVECEMDVRVGGRWSAAMRGSSGEIHRHDGVYKQIVPNELLSFTWAWYTEGKRGHETTVTIEFTDVAGGTEVSLVQKTFAETKHRDMHNEGWTSSFDCLADAVG